MQETPKLAPTPIMYAGIRTEEVTDKVQLLPEFEQILDAINIENQRYESLFERLRRISERIKPIEDLRDVTGGPEIEKHSPSMVCQFQGRLYNYRNSNNNFFHLLSHLEGIFGSNN